MRVTSFTIPPLRNDAYLIVDESSLEAAVIDPGRVHGPRQLTDVYLVALAVRHAGRLVTFDHSISVQSAKGAKAVLELGPGEAGRRGIRVGDRLAVSL